eukprot:8891837-Lingulodinium_polyedra.AAC.1
MRGQPGNAEAARVQTRSGLFAAQIRFRHSCQLFTWRAEACPCERLRCAGSQYLVAERRGRRPGPPRAQNQAA